MTESRGHNVILIDPEGRQVIVAHDEPMPEWAGETSDDSSTSDEGWGGQKVDALKAEIEARNASRKDEDHVVPESNKKADLVAALEADDAAAESA